MALLGLAGTTIAISAFLHSCQIFPRGSSQGALLTWSWSLRRLIIPSSWQGPLQRSAFVEATRRGIWAGHSSYDAGESVG